MKKILTAVFLGIILLMTTSGIALAASSSTPITGADPNGFVWSDDGAGITITGYSGIKSGSLNIPDTINGKPVKVIGDSAFDMGDSMFDGATVGFRGPLTIPNRVTSIGNSAFYGCSGFTSSLTIPASVTSIGDDAFSGCTGLTTIYGYQNTAAENYAKKNDIPFTALTAAAGSTGIQIKIDGVAITTDVAPENINDRTMVPLRVISENLGTKVDWSDPQITLSQGDTQLTLKLASTTVTKNNGETKQLDAQPYLKNNRVMVPLRFIAETFSCNVDYADDAVNVTTEPLEINSVKIQALQQEYHMTFGGVVRQIKSNAYNKEIYNLFLRNKGNQTAPPSRYLWDLSLVDAGDYYKSGQYDFLDQTGNSVQRFDIYTLVGIDQQNYVSAGYSKALLYDATADQWYLFGDTALESIRQQINTADENGLVTVISNTVV